jgi:hypothetical protein
MLPDTGFDASMTHRYAPRYSEENTESLARYSPRNSEEHTRCVILEYAGRVAQPEVSAYVSVRGPSGRSPRSAYGVAAQRPVAYPSNLWITGSRRFSWRFHDEAPARPVYSTWLCETRLSFHMKLSMPFEYQV